MALGLAGAAALACSPPVLAQDWPKLKPIQIVVGFPPSSSMDIVAPLVQLAD
jgi:tripartite-type tricarboxylate transporter receptor subunit TctC